MFSEKSVCLTYLLWIIGGPFGLHHFYLRRYKQAFLYFCLPGGYFGAGWFRDLWRIPEYVKDANEDPEYMVDLSRKMRSNEKPPWKISRCAGQLVVGNLFGVVIMLAVPEPDQVGGWDLSIIHKLISPAFVALGIWAVGNIGREKGGIFWPLVGCYCALPFYLAGFTGHALTTISGILAFQFKSKEWRRQVRSPPSPLKSLFILSILGGFYISLWGSYVYFNMKVRTRDGDEIHIRDAVGNFLKSPAVQEFSKNLDKLFQHMKEHGFWSTMQQLLDSLDPLGEKRALKILELPRNSTQEQIKSKYRELTKIWHPDKQKDEDKKSEAQAKFLEIQEAYEKLSNIKKNRMHKNKRSDYTEERTEL